MWHQYATEGGRQEDDPHSPRRFYHREDFITEKTQVEHYVIGREEFQCLFLPKFYFELNPIERVRWQSKRYCRTHTNFTLAKLHDILNSDEHRNDRIDVYPQYIYNACKYKNASQQVANKCFMTGSKQIFHGRQQTTQH